VKGDDVSLPANQWTDLHVTFKCEKPFAEGWQAYLASAQDGGRFRADLVRLYEGEYVAWDSPQAKDRKNLAGNPGFENGTKSWYFQSNEKQNLRRTYRRAAFAFTRLLANLGVRGETPLVARFATPVGGSEGKTNPSVVRNGDFKAGKPEGVPDDWQFSTESRKATCTREVGPDGKPAVRLTLAADSGKYPPSVMLLQHDVPVKEGQWYRITLRAKADGMVGKPVSLALQSTQTWKSFIDYPSFVPGKDWKEFKFVVESNGTAQSKTRFQIYHGNEGTLWLADVAMTPVAAPTAEGRWSQGLYLDQVEDWDDPYRFFRW
jgi:hypothetical protein